MNESCKCPFSDLEIENLKLLDEKTLKETGDLVIPVLFQNNQYEKIIRIAGLHKEYSHNATVAIRAIISWMIRGKPYIYGADVIKLLPSVIAAHSKEGERRWTEELQKTLRNEKELEKINTWLDYRNNILELAEVFNQRGFIQRGLIEDLLGKAIENDEELSKIEFWFKKHHEIKKLIETFGFGKKIRERAEKTLADGNISFWSENFFSVPYMIKDVGLSDEKVKALLTELIQKNTQKLIGVSSLATENAAMEAIENFTKENKLTFMRDGLRVAEQMHIPIPDTFYQKFADGLLERANGYKDDGLRWAMVVISCEIYEGLKSYGYEIEKRDKILEKYEKHSEMVAKLISPIFSGNT